MHDRYTAYLNQGYQGRSFVGDWLSARRFVRKECVVEVATKALDGDEGAVTALLRIEHTGNDPIVRQAEEQTIACGSVGCNGCVRLFYAEDGPAVEGADCAREIQQDQSTPDTETPPLPPSM